MSNRAEIEKILREAGLEDDAIEDCLAIFTKERITPTVLPRLSLENFRDLGLVMGDRQLLFDHLRSNLSRDEGASAPPPPEAVPLCEQHNQPISGLCTQRGCQCLVCNDCVSVGEHRLHTPVDGLKAIAVLRSKLEQWKPSTGLATQIELQKEKISALHAQLVEEEEELKKLKSKQQVQANAHGRIMQTLAQTKDLSPGPDALRALKELHQLAASLEDIPLTGEIRFTEIVGTHHERLQISENGTKIECVGSKQHRNIGVIAPQPINSGAATIEWAVCPDACNSRMQWIGFGVISVDSVAEVATKDPHGLLYGWSVNGFKWSQGSHWSDKAAVNGSKMKLSLDCEKHTLTLTNLDTNWTSLIADIPSAVYPFVTLWDQGNRLSLVAEDLSVVD
eukprot:TRINITY_DN67014_c9_g3_i1.p1 TRINITY_DN67014_c9_g3~~TRINITY_DN67014_c9_g3_i1.p1  ORF type:complete len:393 (-),score=29.73 TRINITY_DN67014_c9_g3_i1:125-1303(-)